MKGILITLGCLVVSMLLISLGLIGVSHIVECSEEPLTAPPTHWAVVSLIDGSNIVAVYYEHHTHYLSVLTREGVKMDIPYNSFVSLKKQAVGSE